MENTLLKWGRHTRRWNTRDESSPLRQRDMGSELKEVAFPLSI